MMLANHKQIVSGVGAWFFTRYGGIKMSNIVTAEVTIRGTRPCLWHKFGPDSMPLEKQEKEGVAGHNPQEWRRTVLVTKSGQLYFEPTYAFSTIVGGAKYTKKGRGSIQKIVAATLQVTDDRILVDRWFLGFPNSDEPIDLATIDPPSQDTEEPVYLDIRGVVNPSTRGRNVRYRIAVSPGWMATFHILWDKTIVSRNEMEACIIDAGNLVGIGNGRSIGFGRFGVESFEVTE